MNDDLISRSALLEKVQYRINPNSYDTEVINQYVKVTRRLIEEAPAVDAVSHQAFDQILWELDIARQQLKEHNIPFGGVAPDVVNVVRCKDCKHGIWNEDEQMYQCVEGAEFDPELAMYHGFICYEDADFFCKRGERRTDDGK